MELDTYPEDFFENVPEIGIKTESQIWKPESDYVYCETTNDHEKLPDLDFDEFPIQSLKCTEDDQKPKKKPGRKPKSPPPTTYQQPTKPEVQLLPNGKREYDWKKELVQYQWKSVYSLDKEMGQIVKEKMGWDQLFDHLVANSTDFITWINCLKIVLNTVNQQENWFDWLTPLKNLTTVKHQDTIYIVISKDRNPSVQYCLVENPIRTITGLPTLTEIGFRDVLFQISLFLKATIGDVKFCHN